MGKVLGFCAALGALALVAVLLAVQVMTAQAAKVAQMGGGGSGVRDTADCQPLAPVKGSSKAGHLSAGQRKNAATIMSVGKRMHMGPLGKQVAIATAIQESHLHNLSGGDRDSEGLFQQRPSQGWGTPAEVTDPVHASRSFYTHLKNVPGWQDMPVWKAAQSVQRSAFPTAYQKWAGLAAHLVSSGGGQSVSCSDTIPAGKTGPKIEKAIAFAKKQLGKPYVWGAEGPDAFDCSGLTMQAYAHAGIQLDRVTRQQWTDGKHVPLSKAKPGDLLFWSHGSSVASIHHVAIYLGHGKIIEAQQTGVPVHIRTVGLSPPEPELRSEVVRVA
jgi:cell wall-associated NlpC family hydrolase